MSRLPSHEYYRRVVATLRSFAGNPVAQAEADRLASHWTYEATAPHAQGNGRRRNRRKLGYKRFPRRRTTQEEFVEWLVRREMGIRVRITVRKTSRVTESHQDPAI